MLVMVLFFKRLLEINGGIVMFLRISRLMVKDYIVWYFWISNFIFFGLFMGIGVIFGVVIILNIVINFEVIWLSFVEINFKIMVVDDDLFEDK